MKKLLTSLYTNSNKKMKSRKTNFQEFKITLNERETDKLKTLLVFLKKFEEYEKVSEMVEDMFCLGKYKHDEIIKDYF